ncbi:hypothetical protein CERSUDRAFT_96803 [Gelatoporia subvermispora B]|uniref:DUF6534 domain-containing protein n=1 Tax=Ceriporiopsis subvermispora (strain B) TaxID=914234 RepID=M2PHW7_CERS8|nr:hypothetical protein CERSUDRAFT_96803 [Gelatoporia subvermispora B]
MNANNDNTLGACLLGVIVASIFYGITVLQTYMYYRRYQHDGKLLKSTIGLLFTRLLDTIHEVFAIHVIYTVLVTRNGSPTALSAPPWSVVVNVLLTGISDVIVRLLFCQRLWKFSSNRFVVLPVFLGNACTLAGAIAFVVKAATLDSFPTFKTVSWTWYLALVSGVATDLILATSLVFYLWKSRTGFRRTDSMVQVLIMYCINTTLLTSLCETTCFITLATMPDTFVYYTFFTILPKLLLNSLLATYNARDTVRETYRGSGDLISIPLSSPTYGRSVGTGAMNIDQTLDTIRIHKVTETISDMLKEP